MKKKINFKFINNKKIKAIKNFSICFAISLSSCLVLEGLPKDSKNDNTRDYNFEDSIVYYDNNNSWNFKMNATDEDLLKITTDEYKNKYGERNKINLSYNFYLSDLTCLENVYDEINELAIYRCPNIVDLSAIYEMKNLKVLNICESGGVTSELVDYLNKQGIEYYFKKDPLKIRTWLEQIIADVIDDSMSDYDKIKAICFYIANNYSYDLEYRTESNCYPISCLIENGCGVCASDAYVTTILLNMLGIECYNVFGSEHAWNLVKLDDKYYYIDVTALRGSDILCKLSIDLLNFTYFYMTDPGDKDNYVDVNYYEGKENICIPGSLAMDIEKCENNKNFFERNPIQTFNYSAYFSINFMTTSLLTLIVNLIGKLKKLNDEEKKLLKK